MSRDQCARSNAIGRAAQSSAAVPQRAQLRHELGLCDRSLRAVQQPGEQLVVPGLARPRQACTRPATRPCSWWSRAKASTAASNSLSPSGSSASCPGPTLRRVTMTAAGAEPLR